ncbi:unnamed protein product [Rotaria magnacalcarata]|uniref:Uncharacterized protein n=1 Tax=Rotaria magnacalcarata TaxID=392030 RepID=A0A816NKC3_9BILA|nr:unnamed protein product [Rotaria magnacalcarata]CAF1681104.1 unnamed protein product [Rotaria magnacalcarata]CAF2035856.1 unnamed protein product [Rotaria magnacalcarata]CAF3810337.1 unnamed protein product [Rotaria magnacalcarata]CAF3940922.1 unnamed protein product [Rotaria magnacalcarata]
MVEYALAGEGAGTLFDRDTDKTRHWPENEGAAEVFKHCGCTMITKCSMHDDYSTYKFLLSDPLSTQSEIWSYRQQEQQSNRAENIGNYILFHELLGRYPHYFLRGSSKTGDTFYRQKGSRFNYVPPYRVCANELYHKQKQWVLKEEMNESRSRPLSAPPTPTPHDEDKKKIKERKFLPILPGRRNSTTSRSTARSYHRNNYFYDMAL